MKRLPIRMRLTVLYGGLFLLAGIILLAVTYGLLKPRLEAAARDPAPGVAIGTSPNGGPQTITVNGEATTLNHLLQTNQAYVVDSALNSLLTEGSIALLAVGVVAFGFGWLIAERALRPVHEITATARRVAAAASSERGLHERIALTGPRDEIKELADTFDGMLERLDSSFDGQRRFVANASHELRTPLAINRALVEVAMTRSDASPDARSLGETLLAVNARHERLIDGLLTLAESENGLSERSPVDLQDVAAHVLDMASPAGSPAAGLTVRRSLAPAPCVGDPVLLERLVQNLVENAVRYNQPSGWLAVSSGVIDGRAVVTVENTGPAVAPYETETIFAPFRRLGGDRVGSERGAGLGLSIVRAVARAHGGDAVAVPRAGGGLVVTVRLPLAAAT
jgi:signal transduction histidine kinase